MFLTFTKAQAIKALRSAFDDDFPESDFREIKVSMDYPISAQDYPSIWMSFEPQGTLEIVGIGHEVYVDSDTPGASNQLYRWRFSGYLSFTVVALTNLERDRLFDALISVIAFSRKEGQGAFRSGIEGGEFIAMNGDFDQIEMRGFAASAGTPWGSDEMVYEATLALEIIGEFVNTDTFDLWPVSGIETIVWEVGWGDDPTTGEWQHEL